MKDGFFFTATVIQAAGALVALLTWFGITPTVLRQGGAAMPRDAVFWIGVLLIAGSLVTSGVGWYRLSQSTPRFDRNAHLVLVTDKTFRNERVELDGKEFRNCRFENVTLVYNGRRPVGLVGNTFKDSMIFTTDDPSVGSAVGILSGLGFMSGVTRYSDEPVVLKRPLP